MDEAHQGPDVMTPCKPEHSAMDVDATAAPCIELVPSDSKPLFADNSATLKPEHCVVLPPTR